MRISDSSSDVCSYDLYRMGASLWEAREKYIANSPVIFSDQVKTPILIMHNKEDQNVSFSQGLAFYNALRRLKKPCWMLQYHGQGHSVTKHEFKTDYTLRVRQFYDYYLKGLSAPEWMSERSDERREG